MSTQQENIKANSQLETNEDYLLRVSTLQMDIEWENKARNLHKVQKYISELSGKTDIVVLPEMFTTGFSMNCKNLAENNTENTVTTLQTWAKQYKIAICGSFIATENNLYYNRGFLITENKYHFYDKHHLFRMGDESKHFSAGNNLKIIEHKGFNICLQICYDLRFPVWVRNTDNKYDLLIYVASWPQSRIKAWDTLLEARAIENLSYVCGVNRVGTDGLNLSYNGHSTFINYKGERLINFKDNSEGVKTITISKKELNIFRNKFPVWKDADKFTLE
jgi:omega-amidase